jgi:hypothetical protein
VQIPTRPGGGVRIGSFAGSSPVSGFGIGRRAALWWIGESVGLSMSESPIPEQLDRIDGSTGHPAQLKLLLLLPHRQKIVGGLLADAVVGKDLVGGPESFLMVENDGLGELVVEADRGVLALVVAEQLD